MHKVLGVWREPERKYPLRRPKRRWEDSIKMDIEEIGCCYVDWIHVTRNRDLWRALVSTVMKLRVL
jgi:hypothetical protein